MVVPGLNVDLSSSKRMFFRKTWWPRSCSSRLKTGLWQNAVTECGTRNLDTVTEDLRKWFSFEGHTLTSLPFSPSFLNLLSSIPPILPSSLLSLLPLFLLSFLSLLFFLFLLLLFLSSWPAKRNLLNFNHLQNFVWFFKEWRRLTDSSTKNC